MTDEELKKEKWRLLEERRHLVHDCFGGPKCLTYFDAAVKLIREKEVAPLKKQVFALNELTNGLLEKDMAEGI